MMYEMIGMWAVGALVYATGYGTVPVVVAQGLYMAAIIVAEVMGRRQGQRDASKIG